MQQQRHVLDNVVHHFGKAVTVALDATQTRLNQIDKLMAQINKTSDPKAIAEVQARIGAENAQIQNMATQMQIYDRIAASEEKIADQQYRQAAAKRVLDGAKVRTFK